MITETTSSERFLMTGPELETIQTVMAIAEVQSTHISIYLTIVSAYIVVAYVAGERLTRLQFALATFVFVAACLWELMMITTLGEAATVIGREVLQSSEVKPLLGESGRKWFVRILWSSGMFAALVFMWNIRANKAW
jgi:hypothetical protein